MPKLLTDVKDFLSTTRRKDAKCVKIIKKGKETKLKIRCKKYLYTFKVADKEKAEKLILALPPALTKVEL